jgi:hypothetical protein
MRKARHNKGNSGNRRGYVGSTEASNLGLSIQKTSAGPAATGASDWSQKREVQKWSEDQKNRTAKHLAIPEEELFVQNEHQARRGEEPYEQKHFPPRLFLEILTDGHAGRFLFFMLQHQGSQLRHPISVQIEAVPAPQLFVLRHAAAAVIDCMRTRLKMS